MVVDALNTKAAAESVASLLGCDGAHETEKGWMPCKSAEDLKIVLSGGEEAYMVKTLKERGERARMSKPRRVLTYEELIEEIKRRGKRKIRKSFGGKEWDLLLPRGVGSLQGGGPGITSGPGPITASKAEQKNEGIVCVLLPSEESAKPYLQKKGLPMEELHLTVAYFGKTSEFTDALRTDLIKWTYSVSATCAPIAAKVGGVAGLGDDDPQAVVLLVENEKINYIRTMLEGSTLEPAIDRKHPGFIPHMTLGYGLKMDRIKPAGDIVFDRVGIWWGDQRTVIPLIGKK
jgi:2'-5' RNA ligase